MLREEGDEIQGSLHCARDDTALPRFGRDDVALVFGLSMGKMAKLGLVVGRWAVVQVGQGRSAVRVCSSGTVDGAASLGAVSVPRGTLAVGGGCRERGCSTWNVRRASRAIESRWRVSQKTAGAARGVGETALRGEKTECGMQKDFHTEGCGIPRQLRDFRDSTCSPQVGRVLHKYCGLHPGSTPDTLQSTLCRRLRRPPKRLCPPQKRTSRWRG
jgi:hypothetical protein